MLSMAKGPCEDLRRGHALDDDTATCPGITDHGGERYVEYDCLPSDHFYIEFGR